LEIIAEVEEEDIEEDGSLDSESDMIDRGRRIILFEIGESFAVPVFYLKMFAFYLLFSRIFSRIVDY
jgi:hypothetical protein